MNNDSSTKGYRFDATHWSHVARAASDLSEVRRPAMDQLLKQYRPALVSYLAHRKRMNRDDAEDLVQGFILEKILERQLLKSADKEKGKFRTLLIKSLLNYAVDQHRKSNRELPTEFLDDFEVPDEQPIDAFDVPRARLVLAQSLSRMYEECRERKNRHIWGVFAWRILVPAMTDRPPLDYESLVKRFGFESPEQATNALVTAKRHIKRAVCTVLTEFSDCEDLDAELDSIHDILKSPSAFDVQVVSEALPEFAAEMKDEFGLDLDQPKSDSWLAVLEISADEKKPGSGNWVTKTVSTHPRESASEKVVTDPSKDRVEAKPSNDPGTTSISLLERWQSDDADAWRRVVHLYYPLVYGWCRRTGLQPDDSKDVSQEVFRGLVRNRTTFRNDDGKNSFRGWLWGITQNQLKYYWRQRGKRPVAQGGTDAQHHFANVPEEAPPELEADEEHDSALIVRRAAELLQNEFEQRTWQAFWQATMAGRTAAEIAADLGMTTNAVYLAKSRVIRRLREELASMLDVNIE